MKSQTTRTKRLNSEQTAKFAADAVKVELDIRPGRKSMTKLPRMMMSTKVSPIWLANGVTWQPCLQLVFIHVARSFTWFPKKIKAGAAQKYVGKKAILRRKHHVH